MSEHDRSPPDGRSIEALEQSVDTDESASHSVIRCVAVASDVSPADLPPLATAVDTDALDKLFDDTDRAPDALSFRFAGATVTLFCNGRLRVAPARGTRE